MENRETNEFFRVRLVEFIDDKKRKYRVVTNRWDLQAKDIAEIYRRRWAIELFFKWMKQHLNLIKLHNHKPEAAWNQISIAMIAYALCELIKIHLKVKKPTFRILEMLRIYWHYDWKRFLEALHRRPKRTSEGRQKKKKIGRPRKHVKQYKAQYIILNQTAILAYR